MVGFTDNDDEFSFISPEPGAPSIDMLGGYDVLRLAGGTGDSNIVHVTNVEEVFGDASNDRVRVLGGDFFSMSGGGGIDRVELDASLQRVDLIDVEAVAGSAGDDKLVFAMTPGQNQYAHHLKMGGGYDFVDIVNQSQDMAQVFISGVEDIIGSGPINIFFEDRVFMNSITMDNGSFAQITLDVFGSEKTANLLNVEGEVSVLGSSGRDVIRAASGPTVQTFNLGDGVDRLELTGAGDHAVIVQDVEALLGNAGADTVTIRGDIPVSMSIDLAGGYDTLDTSVSTGGYLRVSNVEKIIGGDANEDIVLRTATQNSSVSLGGGYDVLTLADVAKNIVRVSGVDQVYGGTGVDRITVDPTDTTGSRLNGGDGADILIGGAGDDVLVGGQGKDVMTGGAGADQFVFSRISHSDLNTRDIINDFQVGIDKVVFLNGDGMGVFLGGGQFTGSGASEVRFIDATDQLLIDSNGDGAMDMRMSLLGVDGSQLSANDFIWLSPP